MIASVTSSCFYRKTIWGGGGEVGGASNLKMPIGAQLIEIVPGGEEEVGDGSITGTGGIVSDFIILARFCPGALSALPAYHQ
jgi:hypothetical protein